MSVCSIYVVDLDMGRRYPVGTLRTHTDMGRWLKISGDLEWIYEIWKGPSLHSRWCWKDKNSRWGRMASVPKTKNI